MRVSLGRCLASQGEIRIAQFLLSGPPGLLEEVLCHEVAYAAAAARFGARIRPHGTEWRGLMRDAGFEPRTRIPDTELPVGLEFPVRPPLGAEPGPGSEKPNGPC